MNAIDQLLELVAGFSLKKAFSLIAILTIIVVAAWIVDSDVRFTQMNRLEKTTALLERLDALERRGSLTKEIDGARLSILAEIQAMHLRNEDKVVPRGGTSVLGLNWMKFFAGALPWFLISLSVVPGILKNEKNSWPSFFAFQMLTIVFAFVNLVIPASGQFWVDSVILPWGIAFVFAVVPISVAAAVKVSELKRVRENALLKTIQNNLRMIAAACDQFRLENGRDPKDLNEIVGPEKFIHSLFVVDGERYDLLDLRLGRPLEVTRKTGDVVRHFS